MPWTWRRIVLSAANGTSVTGAKRAKTTAAVGVAVGPVCPGMCYAWLRRDRRTCRWLTADTSTPTAVSLAKAAIRAGVSRHTGLIAAGFLLPRQPGSPVLGCS